jgi:hypothetical protein
VSPRLLVDLTVTYGLQKTDLPGLTLGELAEYVRRLPPRGDREA